jgi:hypothetical protein
LPETVSPFEFLPDDQSIAKLRDPNRFSDEASAGAKFPLAQSEIAADAGEATLNQIVYTK